MYRHTDIETSNIPILNLRREFEDYLRLLRLEGFKERVFNCRNQPVEIPNLTWHGLPNDLLTLMLQRSILGIESYLCAAVEYELSRRGLLTEELKDQLSNPFSLSKKAVVALYEKMPELVDPSFMLSSHSKEFYGAVERFYKTVRNPIFHGSQVALPGENFNRVASAFNLLASMYDWIDSWYGAFPSGWKHIRNP